MTSQEINELVASAVSAHATLRHCRERLMAAVPELTDDIFESIAEGRLTFVVIDEVKEGDA